MHFTDTAEDPVDRMDEAYKCLLSYNEGNFTQDDYDTRYTLYKAYIYDTADKIMKNGKPLFQSAIFKELDVFYLGMLTHYGLPETAEQDLDFFTMLFGFDELGNASADY